MNQPLSVARAGCGVPEELVPPQASSEEKDPPSDSEDDAAKAAAAEAETAKVTEAIKARLERLRRTREYERCVNYHHSRVGTNTHAC